MKVTITSDRPDLLSHAQGLLESYCRHHSHENRISKRRAVGYWLRDVYSALVWGDMKHIRVDIRKEEACDAD